MKNTFFVLIIMLAAIIACDTPQSTTGSSTDTTRTNNQTDTSGTMQQRDTTQKP